MFDGGSPPTLAFPSHSQGLRSGGFATYALSAALLFSPLSPHFRPSPSDQPLHSHPFSTLSPGDAYPLSTLSPGDAYLFSTLSPGDAFPLGHHEGPNHTHRAQLTWLFRSLQALLCLLGECFPASGPL